MNRRDFLKLSSLSVPLISISTLEQSKSHFDNKFWDDIDKRIKEFTIQYCGRDLSECPALRTGSKFAYSSKLLDIQVAQAWGCTPSQLLEIPYNDQVDIYAWYIACVQMNKVQEYDEKRKKQVKK